MSESYREQCIKAKAARAGAIDQRPVQGKPKSKDRHPRPWRLEAMSMSTILDLSAPHATPKKNDGWKRWGDYRTQEEAEKVRAKKALQLKKWGWRVVPNEVAG